MTEHPLICVVDDDVSVRESLPDLLKEFGFGVEAFSSAAVFLASDCVTTADCLIVDVMMPHMSGFDLQREVKRRGYDVPIIFITARLDEKTRLRALEEGAVDCLFKPFSQAALLEAIYRALPRL